VALFRFDDKDAEEMAADIEEHWRKSRGPGISAAGPSLCALRAEMLGALDHLEALPSLGDPELYSIKVLPGTEYAFLAWLYGLVPIDAIHPHIVSAFHRPDSPGLVYVETTKPKTLYWAVRNQRGVHILDIVPVAERAQLLDLPETGLHLGWGRVADNERYGGDLVLVHAEEQALIVPRMKPIEDEHEDSWRAIRQAMPRKSRQVRPPQQLFYSSQEAFHSPTLMGQVKPGNPACKEVLLGNFSFLDGLLQLQVSESQVDQGNVQPTEAELHFFRQVHIPQVDLRDDAFPTLALAEGDRFVTKVGRASGYILAIRQVGSERMAACRQHFNGTQPLMKQHVQRYIPVRSLQHHILRIPHLLQPLDRVIVVDGVGEIGQLGRVLDITPDGIVTFQPIESPPSKVKDNTAVPSTTQNTPVSLPMADLSICFQCGDWVEDTRGPHAQQKGFVISLRAGGVAEVYDVSRDSSDSDLFSIFLCKPNRPKFNALTLETIQYDHGDLVSSKCHP
jgi:hypothetical protein